MNEFPCPHCQITLRIRDESLRNRVIQCPDCQADVLIKMSQGKMVGVVPSASKKSPEASELQPAITSQNSKNAKIIAGVVAVILLGILGYFTLPERKAVVENSPSPAAIDKPASVPVEEVAQQVEAVSPAPMMEAATAQPTSTKTNEEAPQSIDPQFEQIGKMLMAQNAIGVPSESGWSWIAPLAESHLPSTATRNKNHPWDSSVNDEFVRRPFPQFLNPAIPQKAGDDSYPATHYVGVSSILEPSVNGQPPTELLGVFGAKAGIKLGEITDGASQTIAVAGITTGLGSWARPGPATTRAFLRAPYINGPDGFGTGQKDGMAVLMADGSVRMLSTNTADDVFRQLVAVNKTPPKASPTIAAMPQKQATEKQPTTPVPSGDAPIGVPVVPDLPSLNLKARLNQKLVGFEQNTPTPLKIMVYDVQELLGVPIDLSRLSEEQQLTPITISMKATTVGDVLREIANSANLGYAVHEHKIELTEKK